MRGTRGGGGGVIRECDTLGCLPCFGRGRAAGRVQRGALCALTLAGAFIRTAVAPRGPVARQGPLRSGFSLAFVNLHSETSTPPPAFGKLF